MVKTFLISILLLCIQPALADDAKQLPLAEYAKGVNAYLDKDYATALKVIKPLAEQGYPEPQYNLGWIYRKGHGVIQNFTRAHMWYNIAASLGHKLAKKNRVSIAKDMTTSQIAKAQLLASECVEKNYKGC